MAKYTGKDMVVKLGTVDVSGQGRSFEVAQSADEVDVTTYGSDDKEFIAGMIERTGTLEVLDDDTNTLIRNATKPGTSGSLTWFPQGTASGNPKFSVATAVVLGQDLSYPYDDAVVMSINLRLSGAVTEGTASGTGT